MSRTAAVPYALDFPVATTVAIHISYVYSYVIADHDFQLSQIAGVAIHTLIECRTNWAPVRGRRCVGWRAPTDTWCTM